MSKASHILVAGVALLAGLLGGRWVRIPGVPDDRGPLNVEGKPPVATEVKQPLTNREKRQSAPESACSDELQRCRSKLDFATTLLEGTSTEESSITIAMPRELEDRQNEDAIRQMLRDWAQDCALRSSTTISVDCSEYPCIGAVLVDDMDDAERVVGCEQYDGYTFAPAAWATVRPGPEAPPRYLQVMGLLDSDAMFLDVDSMSAMKRITERGEATAVEVGEELTQPAESAD